MILRKCSHESKKNEDLALQERFVVIETLILGEEAEVEAEAGKEEYEAEVGIGHLLPLPFHHPIISLLPLLYLLDLRIPGREVVVGHLQDDHGHLRNLLVLLHLHVPTCHIAGELFELNAKPMDSIQHLDLLDDWILTFD